MDDLLGKAMALIGEALTERCMSSDPRSALWCDRARRWLAEAMPQGIVGVDSSARTKTPTEISRCSHEANRAVYIDTHCVTCGTALRLAQSVVDHGKPRCEGCKQRRTDSAQEV